MEKVVVYNKHYNITVTNFFCGFNKQNTGQACINAFVEEKAVYKIEVWLKKNDFSSGFQSNCFILRVKTDLKCAALSYELRFCHFCVLTQRLETKKIINILMKICFRQINARVVAKPFLFFPPRVQVFSYCHKQLEDSSAQLLEHTDEPKPPVNHNAV